MSTGSPSSTTGRIEQVGTPAEIYERPANAFVAGFVGVSNLLERRRPPVHRPAGEGDARRERRCRRRPARRGRNDRGRLLRRDDHPLPDRPRRRRRASMSSTQNLGDLLGGGSEQRGRRSKSAGARIKPSPSREGGETVSRSELTPPGYPS